MAKTITIKVNNDVYEMFEKAAKGDKRSIPNFIEYATLAYLTNDIYVSDNEMKEILNNSSLIKGLENGLTNIKEGKYKIV